MRILFVAHAYDYGRPDLRRSFEDVTFRSALQGMGHDVHPFDFGSRLSELGTRGMRRRLIARAAEVEPDLAFFFLAGHEISPATIRSVGREGRCPTMNWFADDHWRFEGFTRRYAPAFDWSVTTDHAALGKYAAMGYRNVILSQWAVNKYAYGRTAKGLDHDVTFVGMPHGDRGAVIERIRRAGHPVECWGNGWRNGRLEHDQMVRLFGASRINLNLANSSTFRRSVRFRLGALARGRLADARQISPRPPQIKGRTFEVPGSGGFLLTEKVPHLEEYLTPGREIGVFGDTDDLVEQVGYWLSRPKERAAVAEAGYQRTLAEHTYDRRFAAIFRAAGLAGS